MTSDTQALGVRRARARAPAKGWLRHPFRRKNRRPQVLLPAALAVGVVATARPTPASLSFGLPLIVAGAGLRIWAAGHLVKTEAFTVSGPYAYLRHPLYAGTLLVTTGLLLLAGSAPAWVVLAGFLALFFAHYLPRKERCEADRLEARYGPHFRAYRAAVRPLRPRARPWRAPGPRSGDPCPRWRIARLRENDELGTTLVILLLLAAMLLRGVA